MEKYTKGNEHRTDCDDDYEEIRQLYDQINDAGGMVRELKMPKGFLAAVGDIQDYREALGLNPDDEVTEITQDMIDGLPPVLLFAFPGSGETRTEAIRDGMRGWQDSKEIQAAGRILHGSFAIAAGTMSIYMPANADQTQQWTIEYVKDGEVVLAEYLKMNYAPVFGLDQEDVWSLNQRIEQIIAEHHLE